MFCILSWTAGEQKLHRVQMKLLRDYKNIKPIRISEQPTRPFHPLNKKIKTKKKKSLELQDYPDKIPIIMQSEEQDKGVL